MIIEGPFAHELCVFRFAEMGFEVVAGLLAGLTPTEHDRDVLYLTSRLIDRMRDRKQPKLLCLLCDHEFGYDEPPCEVSLAIPWATREHPALGQAICTRCAALDRDEKLARIMGVWRQISAGISFQERVGEA